MVDCIKFLLISIVLATQAALIPNALAAQTNTTQLRQGNPPPPQKNPDDTSAGGRRDPTNCPQDTETTRLTLTPLSPTSKSSSTVAEHPTVFVYVPKTSAKTAEFSLSDRTKHGIYRTTIALTNTPGMIKISLPSQSPPLEIGKQYIWSFALICNPNDRVNDRFVTSTIQRTELDPTRRSQIQQASPKEQISLYQQVGAWYDAITVLYELQRSQPNDSNIREMWQEVLKSVGLEEMIDRKSNPEKPR